VTRATVLAFVLAGIAGLFLRVVQLSSWPPGPWIDEAYALRASRLLPPNAPLFGTTPLTPPGEGFVNAYATNLYLRFARAVDVAAGGGLASFRALSALPSLALLAALLLLALEAGRDRPVAQNVSAALAAGTMWLLTTGRWGWDAVATSALATFATWVAFVADRKSSRVLAGVAGAAVGLGAYGYAAGRLFLAAPLVVLAFAAASSREKRRRLLPLAGIALALEIAVVVPLANHYAEHPERLFPREKELSILRPAAGGAAAALARNAREYTVLFFLRGDRNERHGDPSRSVLPPAVSGLALAGAAWGLVRGGAARALLIPAGLFLAGGLLSWQETGANAYRISPAAPFLLVLAGLGAAALTDALPEQWRRGGAGGIAVVVAIAVASDVVAFADWGGSPRTWGAFGGPERALADAYREALRGGAARLVLDPKTAARNPYVVEELLAPAGARKGPVLFFADLSRETGALRESILYADGGGLAASSLAGRPGRIVAHGADPSGRATFTLYRLSPSD
jgi:hypothetical protein